MAGELLELMEGDNSSLVGTVTRRLTEVIEESFLEDRSRMTGSEVKRRFALCLKRYRELRGDLFWSVPKILDALPDALRSDLDGGDWTPSKRTIWRPAPRRFQL